MNSLDATPTYVRRHLRWGWWLLLVYLALGIALEVMHGFKVGYYLSVANETRRLMWRLAHTHGTLFGLLHIAFAVTLKLAPSDGDPAWRRWASKLLTAGALLLPLGFVLGGVIVYESDPWIGVLLVPVGALLLLVAVGLVALNATRT